jgi:hypothetical protein
MILDLTIDGLWFEKKGMELQVCHQALFVLCRIQEEVDK